MKIQPYRKETLTGADLKPYRLLRLLAVLSLLCLAALAVAPVRSHFTEWRSAQQRYNRLARSSGMPPVEVRLQQIWRADLQVADRCGSCHLGMSGRAEPIGASGLFRGHPPIPHDPAEIGCTICHGGQGRATRAAAAHGQVRFWDHPLLEGRHAQASCGACHGRLQLPSRAAILEGAALFAQRDCRRCHRLDGAGRSKDEGAPGSDLSTIGLKGLPPDWHARHLARRAAAAGTEPWASSYGELPAQEVARLDEYLRTRVGAPRFVLAKATVQELGCRGCHKIHGVGGDEGIDLSNEGSKPSSELDLTRVPGGGGLAGWLAAKVKDPGYVTAGSAMPKLDLSVEERELTTLYLLSLRELALPASQYTRERVRVDKLGERDFPNDGRSLFANFCSGCHNREGQGRGAPAAGTGSVVFPAVAGPDTLALLPDTMLRTSITAGRPGSRMPSWGTKEGGLRPEEIQALVAYLRSRERVAPPLRAVQAARAELALGQQLYTRDCAACHGARGEGSPLGSPIVKRDPEALYRGTTVGRKGTAMGSYGSYGAAELASLLAFMMKLPAPTVEGESRAGKGREASRGEGASRGGAWPLGPGEARRGIRLFTARCQGCHGSKGVGGEAPRIGAPAFLAAAPDGVIAGTIVRGRRGTAMPSFGAAGLGYSSLTAQEVLDIVAYLRSLAPAQKPSSPAAGTRDRKKP